EAFHFYYDENLRLLEQAGAELIGFSPIHSAHLPDVDAIVIGGGYPEGHTAALFADRVLRTEIHHFFAGGRPVYAACGGLMYLCASIHDHAMVAWFDHNVIVHDRLQAIGYVDAVTTRPTILGPAGTSFRGHQFRWSTLDRDGDGTLQLTCQPGGRRVD